MDNLYAKEIFKRSSVIFSIPSFCICDNHVFMGSVAAAASTTGDKLSRKTGSINTSGNRQQDIGHLESMRQSDNTPKLID